MCVLQLKDMFPGFRLSLPPKRWFKDNYDSDFLEDRQLGLQAFMQNLIAHKDMANWYVIWLFKSIIICVKRVSSSQTLVFSPCPLFFSLPVREFLCLDDPPGPFDSLEESRVRLTVSYIHICFKKGIEKLLYHRSGCYPANLGCKSSPINLFGLWFVSQCLSFNRDTFLHLI